MHRINRTYLVLSLVASLGIVQFLFAVAIAIKYYPGGNSASPYGSGYSLLNNFLSDLGRTKTWSGADNSISALVFNLSVILLGASLLPFFAVLPSTVRKGGAIVWISGMLSAIGLIGIGLTPYDRYFVAHHVALGLWIGPMLILSLAYLGASLWEGDASLGLFGWTIALAGAVLAYGLAGTHSGYVAMQKVTAALSIVWFVLIGLRVGTTTIQHISSRRELVERQARQYIARLERGYRRRS